MATTTINDVNLEAVSELINKIKESPENAATKWQAEVNWHGAFRSDVKIRDFDPITSDEPPGLGGTNSGPNPVEQLLGALGNCLAVGYAANASIAGVTIKDLRIEVEGDVDLHTFLGLTQGNAGYENIRVKVHLDCDGSEEQVQTIHNNVVSTSPVGHSISRPVSLDIQLAS